MDDQKLNTKYHQIIKNLNTIILFFFIFDKKNMISINTGHNRSYNGSFESNYIQCGFKYNFESTIGIPNTLKHKSEDKFQISKLTIKSGLVTHIAPIDFDYNDKNSIKPHMSNKSAQYSEAYRNFEDMFTYSE